jgi:hypothetical protein
LDGHSRGGVVTVAMLIEALARLPRDAIVLMECGEGLARVDALELVDEQGPGAPAEVILQPNMDE